MLRYNLLDWTDGLRHVKPTFFLQTILQCDMFPFMLPSCHSLRSSGRGEKNCERRSPRCPTHTLSCHVPIWNGFVSCLTILNIHITSHYITRSWSHWCLIAQSFMSVMIFHFGSFHASFSKYIPVLLHFAPEIAEVELWRVIYKNWHYIKAHKGS